MSALPDFRGHLRPSSWSALRLTPKLAADLGGIPRFDCARCGNHGYLDAGSKKMGDLVQICDCSRNPTQKK